MISFRRWSWVLVLPMMLVAAAVIVRFVYLRRDFRRELGDDLFGPLQVAQVEIEAWLHQLKSRSRLAAALVEEQGPFSGGGRESFDWIARAVTSPDSATMSLVTPQGAVLASYGSRGFSPRFNVADTARIVTVPCGTGYCAEGRAPAFAGSDRAALVIIGVPITDRTFPRLEASQRMRSSRVSVLMRRGDSVLVLASRGRDTTSLRTRAFSLKEAPEHVRNAFSTPRSTGVSGSGLVHERVIYATAFYPEAGWVVLRELHADELIERLIAPLATEILLVFALLLFALGFAKARRRAVVMQRDQELAEVRSDFVAAVSHELRTPLAQIRLFAELLRQGSMRNLTEQQRALNVIEKEAGRLSILVDNVLNYARLRRRANGQSTIDAPASTDVARDVEHVVEAFAPLAAEKGVRVVSNVAASAGRAAVDSQALRQILLNLLENAVKYGPSGQTVAIETSSTPSHVRVLVTDEGPGIPEEEREAIWGAFKRGAAAVSSRAGGSGIGLSVVRDLVAQYGGSAWVENGEARGARFVVEFERGT